MQIIVAKDAGFCVGVERAYKLALKAAEKNKPVFILGPLVHNVQVIRKLEELGIKTIQDVKELPKGKEGVLIISAHGVSPALFAQAEATGCQIIDTTCAWVKKPQKLAKELYDQGYHVVIIGDKNHTEVKGIMGWAEGKAQVIQKVGELEQVKFHERLGVVAQTTQSLENFNAVVNGLKSKTKELKVYNTICEATSKRQNAATEAAKGVDIMLVIGDKKSANTKRLTELCRQVNAATHQIQTAGELEAEWLKGKRKVGLTAGASTPDWVIEKVMQKLKTFS